MENRTSRRNSSRIVDDYGRVLYNVDSLFRIKLAGGETAGLFAQKDDLAEAYDGLCASWDKPHMRLMYPPSIEQTPAEEHARRQNEWLIPMPYMEMDIYEYVSSLCQSEDQVRRCKDELFQFERRGLLPVLKACVYLVEYFRSHKITHGVGRGSSVASYVLFKIGIHRIDSMKFGLEITEFLRDEPTYVATA